MAQLDFTQEEIESLVKLLERALGDMSYEIADTDQSKFRDQLKGRRDSLRAILDKLEAQTQPTSSGR